MCTYEAKAEGGIILIPACDALWEAGRRPAVSISAKSRLVKSRCFAKMKESGLAMGSRGRRLRLVPPTADSRLVARGFPVAGVLNGAKSE
jgi:hypothetical protein